MAQKWLGEGGAAALSLCSGFEEGAAALAAARLMHSSWEGSRETVRKQERAVGMLMHGITSASLPKAPLPRMEPFPGAGGITKGFSAHFASSTPAWAAPGSRIVLWETMAEARAAQAGTGITPQAAPSDAALCSDPFRSAGLQDSPSATVAWERTSVYAGRGWALYYHRPQWGKSSEKVFQVLFLSLCGCGGGRNRTGGSWGGLRGVAKAQGALLCCFKSHRAHALATSLWRLALCIL